MAGINIYEFTAGFRHMKKQTNSEDFWKNPAMVHAAVRHLAHQKGKKIEVVATNSLAIYQLTRWMEQIFPESEGHNGFGMWVSPSMYSEKLHANGQMVQDGERRFCFAQKQVMLKTKPWKSYWMQPRKNSTLVISPLLACRLAI